MPVTITPIAHIESDFTEKFGIPRQSGLVEELTAAIVFEPPYRSPDALRGIEGYSRLWLIWQFSQAVRPGGGWTPTVRPPRLGGNTRVGVFATRSPFRPNSLGLSCVALKKVERSTSRGPVLWVGGADLLDGTPIFDIKPYLPYADAYPDADGGFADPTRCALQVRFPAGLLQKLPPQKRAALIGVLQNDPRPSYQHDPQRVYGMAFAGFTVKFTVDGQILTVTEVTP